MKLKYIFMSIIACGAMASCGHKQAAPEAQAESVSVAMPETDSVVIVKTYPGTIAANSEVNLVARVNGYLKSINYSYGSYVKKGTVLFTIESGNYADAVQSAESALRTARANLEYADSRYNAMTEAYKTDAVSKMEVEQAKSTLEQCKATVKSSEAALRTAQTQLSYCTVTAPFDGHVSVTNYDVGAYLSGEGAPVTLAKIYEDYKMVATFSIDDAEALSALERNVQANPEYFSQIPINFNDSLEHSYTANLDYIAPNVSTSTGTLKLQGVIMNPYGELRSGMYIDVDFPMYTLPHALLIRDDAISTDQLGKYVYVVNDSNQVVYTPIKIGQQVRDSMRVVESGLTPDSRYVTKALLKVRDGMKVKPVLTK